MKKIVIIGPESTGKSTLCEQLAKHYETLWCPEYAREYLSLHGMGYNYDDLLKIARGQIELEDKFLEMMHETTAPSNMLFIDTDMYVMKVWCEFVFEETHPYILDQLKSRKYDLYLLCNTDLPWEHQQLREYPDLETRQKLYSIYEKLMLNQNVPWVEILGTGEQRFQKAVQAVETMLK